MAYPDWLDDDEAKIIDVIIEDALAKGVEIDVRDAYGDEEEIVRLSDADAIRAEVAATGETLFDFYRPGEEKPFGWVLLIHGNGCDVISDYTANEATEALLKRAEAVAGDLAEEQF